MFAIIDLETTGLNPATERITEIAVYLHDGDTITGEYQQLLNPEKNIPYQITALTGISNRMVAGAPRFCEVARRIVEMTEGRIIVGHNVSFDYRFLCAEYRRLFYDYKRKTLCTKKLSRKLMPGMPSYALGAICRELRINNESRHRAGGDAKATTILFEHLRTLEKDLLSLSLKGLNSNLDKKIIDQLPEACGVYYFLDGEDRIIYVGKSLNIRERVLSHLSNNNTRRAIEMRDRVTDIRWEITGSELIALLLESDEIKNNKPIYNRSQRRTLYRYGLYACQKTDEYTRLLIKPLKEGEIPLTSYATRKEAAAHLQYLTDEYELCQKLCGLYHSEGACFYHQVRRCKGACVGREPQRDYNARVNRAIEKYVTPENNFLLVDQGRNENEVAVVKLSHGSYRGFGFTAGENTAIAAKLEECIRPYADNKDVQVIIRGYLRRHPEVKLLRL
jgi:DNA polymerase III subunit epsilon